MMLLNSILFKEDWIEDLIQEIASQKDGKYAVIYCDPPWQYDSDECLGDDSGASSIYPTMDVSEIAKIPVEKISSLDSLIFMWATSQHLQEAIWLMAEWGFQYRTIAFVWHKERTNPGYYTNSSVEICLVGKRGRIPSPRGSRKEQQFISHKRTDHSKKPDEVRLRIERMFPDQKKIELFSRQQSDGWTVWGNQAVCDDDEVRNLFSDHGFPT